MSSTDKEIAHQVQCFQNKRIYLYAIKYQRGMEDGFDNEVWERIQLTQKGRVVHYAQGLPNRWTAPRPKYTKVKRAMPYIIGDNGKEYLDEDYYICNPQASHGRFVVHKFKFEEAYEPLSTGQEAEES